MSPEENQPEKPVLVSDTSSTKKPFFGGYRHKLTGTVYLHAKVQTAPSPWKYTPVERFHRTTQTVETKSEEQQTSHEAFTQVAVSRLYLPADNEKVLFARGEYESADSIQKRRLEAVVTLQKHLRGWLARRLFQTLKNEGLSRLLWDREQIKMRNQEEEDWLNELEHRQKYPKTKDDFTLLFSELQKWWIEQSESLKSTKSGAELKASHLTLLNKEVGKIQVIEKKRQKVRFESVEKRHNFLSKAAAPKSWKGYVDPVLVETAGTQRAGSLRDLYLTLSKPRLVPEDRISALMTLKETVKSYECALTNSIVSLVNREIDLLRRGVSEKHLSGLRLRIRNLLWQFVRQPAFNPEAQRLSKLYMSDKKKPLILLCSSCSEYYILPSDTLEEGANCSVLQQRFMKCAKCKYLENEGWIRKDLEIYKRMLRLLKAEEQKKESMSGIIDLLQPHDIGYMVEKIWRCQSCLSGLSVLKDLEFVRWNILKNWTPWNSLLVTREEAVLHNRLDNFKQMYDKSFCKSVHLKHVEARNYFSSVPRFLPYLQLPYSDSDYDTESGDEGDAS